MHKGENTNRVCMPILPLERKGIRLRPEVQQLFSLASIDEDTLLYLPECIEAMRAQKERVCLHLVDHNELSPVFHGFEDVGTCAWD